MITRRTFVALSSAAVAAPALAWAPASQGRIDALGKLDPSEATEPRVRVWLPPGYDRSRSAHRTFYMLDGQYAFASDSEGVNFATDRRVTRLIATRRIKPTLIVAIDNLEEDRFLQYMPQTIYDRSTGDLRASIEREIVRTGAAKKLVSTPFIQFLIRLKRHIDAKYRTSPNRLDTAIFGASMAGVMSGAIFVEAQQVFGLGACMSPNWPIYDDKMIDHPQLMSIWPTFFAQLGPPRGRKLWLDHGTKMMDAGMAPHQAGIARQLRKQGWRPGLNLQTQVYKGAGHAFAETAAQMDEVLTWLLG